MKRKVLTNFQLMANDAILVKAKTILSSMTGNINFETPLPPLTEVALVVQTYETALIKAKKTHSIQDIEAKKIAKLQLQSILSKLANYVNLAADGDIIKLESSGFTPNKMPHTHGILEAPRAISLISIHASQVEIKIDKVENASGYLVMYREIGEEAWSSELLSKRTGTIKKLKSIAKYEFKAAATSTASSNLNEYNYSQIVSVLAQ